MMYFGADNEKVYELTTFGMDGWQINDSEGGHHAFKQMTDAFRYLVTVVSLESDRKLLGELIKEGEPVKDLLYLSVPEVLELLGKSAASKANLRRDHPEIFKVTTKIGQRRVVTFDNVKRLLNGGVAEEQKCL